MDNNQKISLPEPNSNLTNTVQDITSNNSQNLNLETNTVGLENVNLTAKDSDLIEKHWVDEIKKIFHNNRGNPYQQLKAYNNLKQDYLLKRFNKSIKALNK